MRELKRHEEHLKKYHQNPDQNCHSIIIHNHDHNPRHDQDDLEDSDDEADDEDDDLHNSILEIFKVRLL